MKASDGIEKEDAVNWQTRKVFDSNVGAPGLSFDCLRRQQPIPMCGNTADKHLVRFYELGRSS